MKKGIAAILLLLYVAFSTGLVISFHYCMDDLDTVQLGTEKTEVCGKCGMHKDEANSCCNDEIKIFKIQDDQQSSGISFKLPAPDPVTPALSEWQDNINTAATCHLSLNNHSPPLNKQGSYLQNCVFRI